MVVVRWNFPNGNNGDALTPVLAGATLITTGGGTATISTAQSIIGAHSAKLTCTTPGNLFIRRDDLNSSSISLSSYIYSPDNLTQTSGVIWVGVGETRSIQAEMTPARKLRIRDFNNTTLWTGTQTVPLNTWIRLTIYATPGVSTGSTQFAWYLGHSLTPVESSTLITGVDLGPSNFTDIRTGPMSTGTNTHTFYIGAWAYDQFATGLLPPYNVGTLVAVQRRESGSWVAKTKNVRQGGVWVSANLIKK